jgi:ankyrin repeat protein
MISVNEGTFMKGFRSSIGSQEILENFLGHTPLHIAVKNGDIATVDSLTKSNQIDVNKQDVSGQSPLHIAAQAGNAAAVQLLLDSGASINQKDKHGWTALHFASDAGSTEVVKRLLERNGIEPEIATTSGNKRGFTPLFFAATGGHQPIVELLVERDHNLIAIGDFYGDSVLQAVATTGRIDMIRWLLNDGADPNQGSDGWTSLHRAVLAGHLDIVQLLLEKGADIDAKAKTSRERTPLSFAIEEYIIACKCANIIPERLSTLIQSRNTDGPANKIVQYASIIHLLIQHGADVDTLNLDDMSDVDSKAFLEALKLPSIYRTQYRPI